MINQHRYESDHVVVLINRRIGPPIECLVDFYDWERMKEFGRVWSAMWNEAGKTFYVFCQNLDGGRRPLYLHRWLMDTPNGNDVDHENYNGLNNLRSNLSNVPHSINVLNRRTQSNKTSGYRGVTWSASRKKFTAQVKKDRKCIFLGRFNSAEEANAIVSEYRKSVLGCRS